MSRFLRSLVEAGEIPLYFDPRTGSLQDLGGMGNHPTVTSCSPVRAKGGYGLDSYPAGSIKCADTTSLRLSQLSIVALVNNAGRLETQSLYPRIISRTDAGIANSNYDFLHYSNGVAGQLWLQSFPAGGLSTIGFADAKWAACRTVGVTWVGGTSGRFFANDSLLGTGSANLPAVATGPGPQVNVFCLQAGVQYHVRCGQALVLVNEPLSDADMCRLMRELTAAPGIVARARKGFSIPYPTKTPSEYAAGGITCDIPGARFNGKPRDLVSGASAAAAPTSDHAKMDAVLGGPFDGGLRTEGEGAIAFTTPVGNSPVGRSEWTLEWWGKPLDTTKPTLVRKWNAAPYYIVDDPAAGAGRRVEFTTASGAIILLAVGAIRPVCSQSIYVACRYAATTQQVFTNGVAGVAVDNTAQVGTLWNTNALSIAGIYGGNLPRFRGEFQGFRMTNRALSDAEIRSHYLEGARKCLLDARIHSDGSCPVSLAAVGAGNEIANGWKVQSGTWKVVEDAPNGGRPGERWLKAQAAATVSIRCNPQAFGSWWGKIRFNGVEQEWLFVASNETSVSAATQNGYGIHVTAGGVLTLRERAAGAAAAILTPGVVLANGTEYEFWPTRRADGLFDLNIKGGAYADWTSLGTVTDTTTTQGGYQVLYGAGANVESQGAMAFLGEMTPAEAKPRGLIS